MYIETTPTDRLVTFRYQNDPDYGSEIIDFTQLKQDLVVSVKEEGGIWSADHSFAQIAEAVEQGVLVRLVDETNSRCAIIGGYGDDSFTFVTNTGETCYFYQVTSENVWSLSTSPSINIADNLSTDDPDKALAASQGVALKEIINVNAGVNGQLIHADIDAGARFSQGVALPAGTYLVTVPDDVDFKKLRIYDYTGSMGANILGIIYPGQLYVQVAVAEGTDGIWIISDLADSALAFDIRICDAADVNGRLLKGEARSLADTQVAFMPIVEILTQNGYIDSSGAKVTSSVCKCSDFINYDGISKIRISGFYLASDRLSIAFYDGSKAFISGVAGTGTYQTAEATPPAGTVYIRFSTNADADVQYIMANSLVGVARLTEQTAAQLREVIREMGDNVAANMLYLSCTTAGSIAAKVVANEDYTLLQGGALKVKFANKNSAASGVTLQIGSADAKPLYYNGAAVAGATNTWENNEVVYIYYDGTNYQAWSIERVNDLTTGGSKALAAEQGKALKGLLDAFGATMEENVGIHSQLIHADIAANARLSQGVALAPGKWIVAFPMDINFVRMRIYDRVGTSKGNTLLADIYPGQMYAEVTVTNAMTGIWLYSDLTSAAITYDIRICEDGDINARLVKAERQAVLDTQTAFVPIAALLSISGYIDSAGAQVSSTVCLCSDYIKYDGLSKVQISGFYLASNRLVIAYYDADRTFISGVAGTGTFQTVESTPPANTAYIRLSTNAATNIQYIKLNSIVGVAKLVQGLDDSIKQLQAKFAPFNPVKGVTFGATDGDIAFQNALKAIWLEVADDTVPISSPLRLGQVCNKAGYSVECIIRIYLADGTTTAYVKTNATQLSGIQHLRLPRSGESSPYSSYLHLVIDFDKLKTTRVTSGLGTTMVVSELPTQEVATLPEAVYPLYGKKIVCFGDSITEFKGNDNLSYPDYLALLSYANVINLGVGGTDLRERGTPVIDEGQGYQDSNYAALDIVNMIRAACGLSYDADHTYLQLAQTAAEWIRDNKPSGDDNTAQVAALAAIDWSKVDYVVIMGGTNDWHGGNSTKWGTASDTTPSTTFGAINFIISTFLSTYKHIKLFWATPMVRWIDYAGPDDPATVDSKFSDVYTYDGVTLKEFAADIYDLVKSNHIPVRDMYNDMGWTMYNFSQYFNDNDGTHPRGGFKEVAKAILSKIKETA